MKIVAITNCNILPIIQSVMQNGGSSLDFRAMQINFEATLEIRECVWSAMAVESSNRDSKTTNNFKNSW